MTKQLCNYYMNEIHLTIYNEYLKSSVIISVNQSLICALDPTCSLESKIYQNNSLLVLKVNQVIKCQYEKCLVGSIYQLSVHATDVLLCTLLIKKNKHELLVAIYNRAIKKRKFLVCVCVCFNSLNKTNGNVRAIKLIGILW